MSKCWQCICDNCTREKCPNPYAFKFQRPGAMCHVCFRDDRPPTLVCDLFVNKHVHKVYKMKPCKRRKSPTELKLDEILARLAEIEKRL